MYKPYHFNKRSLIYITVRIYHQSNEEQEEFCLYALLYVFLTGELYTYM